MIFIKIITNRTDIIIIFSVFQKQILINNVYKINNLVLLYNYFDKVTHVNNSFDTAL